ncbi:hypothetical protein [Massilia litorea]|uniref:Uncharacterized protein n=1 Tax=Massilia litorea TaxID=2769491 RepID=A0A7L9U9N2_9BURK|nr:hypothetical protein [Massilia litorea]QOL50816.1 hypothetical protein LPB04_05885 [Massilia litorea]
MTSTTVAPPRLAPSWIKTALLAAAVFVLCWGGAIAYWRSAEHGPATGDLLLALLAVPLGVLAAVWLGKKLVTARPAAAAAAGTATAAQPALAPPAAPPLAVLAAALRAPHGDSPDALATAIAGNQAHPDLDPELIDDDGFPLTSARSDAAVDEALQEEVHEWLILNGMAELRFGAAQWRALTLGTAVVRDLANEAVMQLMPPEGAPPPLRLLPLFPPGWTVEQRHAAGLWFRHTVAQFGWPVDSLTRIDAPLDAAPTTILGLCADASGARAPQLATMLIACASSIDQQMVDGWSANGSLQTPARAQGRIPGEGAAGLLLTSLDGASKTDGAVFAQLYPMVEARREVSAGSAKRAETTRLTELAQRAVQAAGLGLSDLACVAADTDHRTSRGLELMGLVSSALPDLDTTADVLRTGVATGTCGAVPFMCALALARHAALAGNAPALFVSHEDPFTCSMALVAPPPAPAQPA